MRDEQLVELVITAPGPLGLTLADKTGCRTTLGVLLQLLLEAEHRVLLAAPFLQHGYALSAGPLSEALKTALRRRVAITLISTGQSLQTLNADELRLAGVSFELYRPVANVEDERRIGSHAKVCIADGKRAYVGSANLTGPALAEHIEMGLFVSGPIARQIEAFWTYAFDAGLFVSV